MKYLLVILTLLALVGAASAGGYVADQLENNHYGLYYKVNQDYSHIGVSVEDDGYHEAAVEQFLKFTMGTFWDYANYVDPRFNGVFRVAGFENYHGEIDEVFWYEVSAEDARYMSRSVFIADGMQYYYEDPIEDSGYYTETYVTYPDDYYISQTSYSGNGVILVDTYEDMYGPGNGEILITTEQDAADWNTPI
jgi:hypothetical protein